jgi:hypothetical protein
MSDFKYKYLKKNLFLRLFHKWEKMKMLILIIFIIIFNASNIIKCQTNETIIEQQRKILFYRNWLKFVYNIR